MLQIILCSNVILLLVAEEISWTLSGLPYGIGDSLSLPDKDVSNVDAYRFISLGTHIVSMVILFGCLNAGVNTGGAALRPPSKIGADAFELDKYQSAHLLNGNNANQNLDAQRFRTPKQVEEDEQKGEKPALKVLTPRRGNGEIGRAVQQECRDRSRMPSSA
eukprot:TRINITY_DN10029_c0_g1_i2.p1 TRINITY_DN10029_c0_g1~~TRINITY_DN10029_c0_g1_i2.p1  ORF type:complete len:178 (-),score=14.73 TRINITY_DN10029_c0_g1_i2:11-496(-)